MKSVKLSPLIVLSLNGDVCIPIEKSRAIEVLRFFKAVFKILTCQTAGIKSRRGCPDLLISFPDGTSTSVVSLWK